MKKIRQFHRSHINVQEEEDHQTLVVPSSSYYYESSSFYFTLAMASNNAKKMSHQTNEQSLTFVLELLLSSSIQNSELDNFKKIVFSTNCLL